MDHSNLHARHIQDFSNASQIEPHWGYAGRVVPCTNDAGSCAYLDEVYRGHDRGMLYSGILWSIIGGLLLIFAICRHFPPSQHRWVRASQAWSRRWLLPEFRSLRWLFGHTTRLQVLVLAATCAYLFVFSFAGITYAKWVTPVKNSPGVYNTRTSLGPWADRLGLLAYALTPLSILLANRESLLSLCTGIPYHHFNFLHRWLGHVIFAQSVLHTIGWCVIEIRLYQPQPAVAKAWIKQLYMVWGVVAMILLILLWGLSTPWGRRATGYEFFRKSHYVLAMVYIGACWGHWANLKCFLLPSLILWFIDRGARLARTGLIHYRVLPGGKGMFTSIPASVTQYESDVLRLDLALPNPVSWEIGQHFYLTFVQGGIWQSHPFTPLSLPGKRQAYVLRAKSGETRRVAAMEKESTPVILTGPYGSSIVQSVTPITNVLAVAGGTGIAFVLPILLDIARRKQHTAKVQLFWVVRAERHVEWIAEELDGLRKSGLVSVTIHSTGSESHESLDTGLSTPSEDQAQSKAQSEKNLPGMAGRPDLRDVVRRFVASTEIGDNCVFVSGPGGMTSDVRDAVAGCNDAKAVWAGDRRKEVQLVYDERLE
jgi:predicted ferric reductase